MAETDLDNQNSLEAPPAPAEAAEPGARVSSIVPPETAPGETQAENGPARRFPGRAPADKKKTAPPATSEEPGHPQPADSPASENPGQDQDGFSSKGQPFWSKLRAWWRNPPTLSDIYVWFLALFGLRLKPEQLLRRAHSLAIREKWGEAVAAYQQVIVFRPLNTVAYDSLGQVYRHLGLTEKAEVEFTIANSLVALIADRNNLEAAAQLVKAMVVRGQPKEVISLVEPVWWPICPAPAILSC